MPFRPARLRLYFGDRGARTLSVLAIRRNPTKRSSELIPEPLSLITNARLYVEPLKITSTCVASASKAFLISSVSAVSCFPTSSRPSRAIKPASVLKETDLFVTKTHPLERVPRPLRQAANACDSLAAIISQRSPKNSGIIALSASSRAVSQACGRLQRAAKGHHRATSGR